MYNGPMRFLVESSNEVDEIFHRLVEGRIELLKTTQDERE
ncbi:hypothetical protein J19TS1_42200 [Heyndrickxia oleronia]|nr:hypothetical protein J19TS1_42200 [Heyndrickxia oleronia]